MLEQLKGNTRSYDLVFWSYAIHHLPHEEKARCFELAYQALTENGLMIMIDVVRDKESEDRDSFLHRNCDWIRQDWTSIPLTARETVCVHAQQDDYPETMADIRAFSTRAGFMHATQINKFQFYQTWSFAK